MHPIDAWIYLLEDIMQYQNKREEVQETQLDYVLDITIAYPQGKPLDLPDIVTGLRPACKTYFIYRLYHSSEVSGSIRFQYSIWMWSFMWRFCDLSTGAQRWTCFNRMAEWSMDRKGADSRGILHNGKHNNSWNYQSTGCCWTRYVKISHN